MALKRLTISVGIIRNSRKEIFITQRDASSHMAGFWEFPGGKVEAGETPVQAVIRELQEETGIVAQQPALISSLEHVFPDRVITLHFHLIEKWHGEPYGKEGQPMRWIPQTELKAEEFPPANESIVKALSRGEI
ncbi:dGTP-preferring nucleoside triphosphate pyrophosphohydrolase [Enterobacterales bacterium]|nr:dGTP-preferring nucleoside triphosphate pyrophosphohydrolase [Enterobacterales bacterium]